MSRSGLFRAAALLAAGASPLLVGAANAAETPNLPAAPDAGTDKLVQQATGATDALDATKAVKLPAVQAPAAPAAPEAPKVAPQVKTPSAERSLPVGAPLPDAGSVLPAANVANLPVPAVSQLPGLDTVQGTLPPLG